MCHQLPIRSPQWAGLVFPLCWRCAGLHLGFFAWYVSQLMPSSKLRRPRMVADVVVLVAFLLPLAIDGLGNFLSLWSSPGWVRAFTGLTAGVALPLLLNMLAQTFDAIVPASKLTAVRHSNFVSWLPLCAMIMGSAGIWLLGHPFATWVFRLLEIAAATGTVLFFVQFMRAGFLCLWGNAICNESDQTWGMQPRA
ncbi:MAG TPA: DUF2085 domain-containing protein [Candidatus Angelobacter sp.]|nr:DUF2085 domain-containing protein [Candidatus Angelobacter sp.]